MFIEAYWPSTIITTVIPLDENKMPSQGKKDIGARSIRRFLSTLLLSMMKKLIPRERLEYKPESFPSLLSRTELRDFSIFTLFAHPGAASVSVIALRCVPLSELVDYKARHDGKFEEFF